MIGLINDTIDTDDINSLIEWLSTYPRLTKGALTKEFESEFAAWLGCDYAVFVNSGSSANLIMVYALMASNHLKNNKVVVPSLCWITDVAPIMQFGLTPILCDCDLNNLSVDLNHLEIIFRDESPAALLLVSLLGFSPDIDRITELCKRYDVVMVEDNCESLGSTYDGIKLGNFGLMSTTSMYFGHHISTIEGGMVFTNDKGLYNVLLSLRSHGWARDWDELDRIQMEQMCGITGINSLYTFFYPGFNVRATDLQAYIGLRQLKKLDDIINIRNRNYKWYLEYLDCPWKPSEVAGSFTSNFAYPIISEKKDAIVEALASNNIEARPLVCGSMGTQPFYRNKYGEKHLVNCDIVDKQGIYVPNHPGLTEQDVRLVCSVVNSVL